MESMVILCGYFTSAAFSNETFGALRMFRLISLRIMKYNEGNSGHIRTPDRWDNISVTAFTINRHTQCGI